MPVAMELDRVRLDPPPEEVTSVPEGTLAVTPAIAATVPAPAARGAQANVH